MINLIPLLLATLGLLGMIVGRFLFGRWYNHVSLYALVWGAGLALYELRLINYAPLKSEVWLMILYAWIAFALGSVVYILARSAARVPNIERVTAISAHSRFMESRLLAIFTFILSIVALATTLQHWSVLIDQFGSVTDVLMNGYKVYRMRVADQLPGMIPYFDSFSLTASFFGGLYSSRVGKIKPLTLLPLFIVIVEDIGIAGRAKMLMAAILFTSAYFIAKVGQVRTRTAQPGRWKRLLATGLIVAIFLVAAEFVRNIRGAFESFYGASRKLSKLEDYAFLTPSLYMYLSSHFGVFNAYWKAEAEHPFPGSNTFAPLFRVLAKWELAESVPYYQRFYNIPFSSNTGTYLRELHADFGAAGILVVPFLLSLACTILWVRLRHRFRLATVSLLTHLYVIVIFSFLYQATRLGYWVVSLVIAWAISSFIDQRCGAVTSAGDRDAC